MVGEGPEGAQVVRIELDVATGVAGPGFQRANGLGNHVLSPEKTLLWHFGGGERAGRDLRVPANLAEGVDVLNMFDGPELLSAALGALEGIPHAAIVCHRRECTRVQDRSSPCAPPDHMKHVSDGFGHGVARNDPKRCISVPHASKLPSTVCALTVVSETVPKDDPAPVPPEQP